MTDRKPPLKFERASLLDQAMVMLHVEGLKLCDEPPKGYAQLDSFSGITPKGIKGSWRGRGIWLPKRVVVQIRNKRDFYAPYPLLIKAHGGAFSR